MILDTLPASKMTPWMLSFLFKCCRSNAIPLYACTIASQAFRPVHGPVAACAALPLYFTFNFHDAFVTQRGVLKLAMPCVMTHESNPFQAPCFAIIHLPPLDSSAGVPMTTSVPAKFLDLMTVSTPIAEAIEDVAMRLCPHAWPIPGRASASVSKALAGQCIQLHVPYSALKQTILPPSFTEKRASKAVSMP